MKAQVIAKTIFAVTDDDILSEGPIINHVTTYPNHHHDLHKAFGFHKNLIINSHDLFLGSKFLRCDAI